MRSVERACLVGAVIWTVSHGPLPALLSLPRSDAPWSVVLALVVVLAATAVVARPLVRGPLRLGAGAAWAAAAVLPLAGLAVMPHLDPDAYRTSANWWPGATQVVAAALVLRRRRAAAAAGELAAAAVGAVLVVASGRPDPWADVAALNQPAIMWFCGAVGVRALFDRTARDVARHDAAAGTALARAAATAARSSSARTRRAELDATTVPLLRTIAALPGDDPRWPATSRAAAAQERLLRDDLRARALLDADVREVLRAARSRGAQVDVVDDRDSADRGGGDAAVPPLLRRVLLAVLPVTGTAHLTARATPTRGRTTLAVDGSPAEAAAAADALRTALRDVDPRRTSVEVDVVDGSLWVEVTDRRSTGDGAVGPPARETLRRSTSAGQS